MTESLFKFSTCILIFFILPHLGLSQGMDPTFNPSDTVNFVRKFSGGEPIKSQSLSDGSSISIGSFTQYDNTLVGRIVKTLPNGSIDESFNSGTGADSTIEHLLILSDGRIFLTGLFTHFNGINVGGTVLLLANGNIDIAYTQAGNWPVSVIKGVTEQNGKIIITGNLTSGGLNDHTIFRITSNGSIDPSFIGPGTLNGITAGVKTNSNDGIFIYGSFTQIGAESIALIALLFPDGTINPSFTVNSSEIGNIASIRSLSLDQDLPIIVSSNYLVRRLLLSGAVDPTFSCITNYQQIKEVIPFQSGDYILWAKQSTTDFVIRLNNDGSVNDTFVPYQQASAGEMGIMYFMNIKDISIRVDGRILLTQERMFLLNPDMTIDPGYNHFSGAAGGVNCMKTTPDGKILIGGYFPGYNFHSSNGIARLNPNGEIDLTFATMTGFDFLSEYNESRTVSDIEIQPDGKILVCGTFTRYNGESCSELLRLLPTGVRDTLFNYTDFASQIGHINGILTLPNGKSLLQVGSHNLLQMNQDGSLDQSFYVYVNGSISTYRLLPNGKILVAGNFATPAADIIVYNQDGTVDASFSSGNGIPSSVVSVSGVQQNGRILIGGKSNSYNGNASSSLFRIMPDGSFDSSFYSEIIPLNYRVSSLHVLPDDKILATCVDNIADSTIIYRLFSNGLIDTILWSGEVFIPITNLQPDGKIIAVGRSDIPGFEQSGRHGVMRVLNDGYSGSCLFFNALVSNITNASCTDSASITAQAIFGTPPYLYSWDNAGWNQNDTVYQPVDGGIHYLTITDSVGCFFSTGILIDGPLQTGSDFAVQLVSGNFRPGFPSTIHLDAYNNGCNSVNGQVMVIIDSLLTYNNAIPMPTSVSGDTLIWDIGLLSYDSLHFTSDIYVSTVVSAQIGDIVQLGAYISTNFPDLDTANNIREYTYNVFNGYDPNDKKVYPEGYCTPHYIKNNQLLTYTVRFQNTGNSEAINIAIIDSLSDYLDINSLRVVSSSHNMYTEVLPNNVIEFHFDNINLPDSSSNSLASNGYVIYEIKPNAFLLPESVITNKAHIYFDFNPAIITNEVFNTISLDEIYYYVDTISITSIGSYNWDGVNYDQSGIYSNNYLSMDGCDSLVFLDLTIMPDVTGITEVGLEGFWGISPNPTTGICIINPIISDGELLILNNLGQVLQRVTVSPENNVIDLSNLKNGVYQFVFSSNFIITRKSVLLNR